MNGRSAADTVRLVEALLTLIENGICRIRQTENARHLIKALTSEQREPFLQRIRTIEEASGPANNRSNRTVVPRERNVRLTGALAGQRKSWKEVAMTK